MNDKHKQDEENSKAVRLSRFILAVATCLGALGMAALLYFPLRHLN